MHGDDFWVPLVDEPIGDLVAEVQRDDAEVAALVASPRRQLAFRTFAYVRAGLVLGELLVDTEVSPDAGEGWVREVLRDPAARARVVAEIRAVALEVAADRALAEADEATPDPQARARFLKAARKSRGK
jgi:hypothetical protein